MKHRTWRLPGEILLGRAINKGAELQLIDQLAASTAFIKNTLRAKAKSREPFYAMAGRNTLRR